MLSVPPVPPSGNPDVPEPNLVGSQLPIAPEPVTDGGGDRLVVVTAVALPSATLLAAQQLSDEADPHARRRRAGALVADRRRRAVRGVVAQRRADRADAAGR